MNGEALQKYVYCVSCLNGREEKLRKELLAILPINSVILSPVLERTEKHHKEWIIVSTRLTPGYLFIYTEEPIDWHKIKGETHIIRLLSYASNEVECISQKYCLRGSDLSFANWIYRCNGIISVSNAVSINQTVVIVDGPLTACDGKIIKIDKHNRKALLVVDFDNTLKKVWLSFNWIDPNTKK